MQSQVYIDEEFDRPPSTYSDYIRDPSKEECWLRVHAVDKEGFKPLFKESIKGWVVHRDGWARYKWLSDKEKEEYHKLVNEFMKSKVI